MIFFDSDILCIWGQNGDKPPRMIFSVLKFFLSYDNHAGAEARYRSTVPRMGISGKIFGLSSVATPSSVPYACALLSLRLICP